MTVTDEYEPVPQTISVGRFRHRHTGIEGFSEEPKTAIPDYPTSVLAGSFVNRHPTLLQTVSGTACIGSPAWTT